MDFRHQSVALLLLALLFLSTAPHVAAQSEEPGTHLKIEVGPEGDVEWSLEMVYLLGTEDEREAFESVSENVTTSHTTRLLEEDLRSIAATASGETGREMEIRNFTAASSAGGIARETGRIQYSFTWTAFASVEDGNLSVERIISGYDLGPGDSLSIDLPESYSLDRVEPEPDARSDNSLTWRGETRFSPDQPLVEASRVEEPESTELRIGQPDAGKLWPMLGAVAAFLILVAYLFFYVRRGGGTVSSEDPEECSWKGDESPLPDRDLALRVIEEEGGMRQSELVERTGWSPHKVSRVTGQLEDEGEIEKKRVGKERILERKK